MDLRDYGPRHTRQHTVTLALTDGEWDQLCADAKETAISPDLLLGLVVAFTCRAKINHAACLALYDVTSPPGEYLAREKERAGRGDAGEAGQKGTD